MLRVCIPALLVSLVSTSPLRSQSLHYLGLGHEAIGSIAADRINTNTVYVGSVWHLDSTGMSPGGVFKTTDGGVTWDTLLRGFAALDMVLSPTNPQTVYATLGTSGIKKSLDGGKTWAAIDSDIAKKSINGQWLRVLTIDPINSDTLYVGASGPLGAYSYKSTNQGMNWTSMGDTTLIKYGISNILVNPKNTQELYAASSAGFGVFRSTDGGVTWVYRGLSGPLINTLELGNDHSTLYAGLFWQDGGLLVSRDSGMTWQGQNEGLPDTGTIGCVRLISTASGDIICLFDDSRFGSNVYYGNSGDWKLIGTVQKPSEISATLETCGNTVYVGAYGVYVTQIVTSVSTTALSSGSGVSLLQNYPNPFNPSTTIRYALPQRSRVTLSVYNTLGQLMGTLVDGEEEPGYHEVKFDGSNLASGVYFYRMRAGDYVETRKLLLLR